MTPYARRRYDLETLWGPKSKNRHPTVQALQRYGVLDGTC